jgi:hypothetical protein
MHNIMYFNFFRLICSVWSHLPPSLLVLLRSGLLQERAYTRERRMASRAFPAFRLAKGVGLFTGTERVSINFLSCGARQQRLFSLESSRNKGAR